MGENLARMTESRRRDPSMKAISAAFPSLLPSALDRFLLGFIAPDLFFSPSLCVPSTTNNNQIFNYRDGSYTAGGQAKTRRMEEETA